MKLRKMKIQLPVRQIITETCATSDTPIYQECYIFTRKELEEFFNKVSDWVGGINGMTFDSFIKEQGE